ncbi:YihY/virulence factor BrkB family protein [Tunturiibacter lichenicola]|uniref:YihY/virulence factor BrkB family protein n=1 Tax=Tunturiibacter lichenicola TaxID=2051959 RepID=UPI003D9B1C8E
MTMEPRVWLQLVQRSFEDWNEDDAPRLGAALAFYTILSVSPLVILLVAAAAIVFSKSSAEVHLLSQVQGMAGTEGREAVRSMLASGQKESAGIFATVIGLITLLFGASGVFAELRSALNTIWEAPPKRSSGVWSLIKGRIFSLGMVLSVGFLLFVSLIASAGFDAVAKFSGDVLPISPLVMEGLNFVFSFVGIAVLFGFILKYLPDTHVDWKDVRFGATFTASLYAREIVTGPLPWESKSRIGLWSSRIPRRNGYLGVLLRADIFLWCRIHSRLFHLGGREVATLGDVKVFCRCSRALSG